MNSSGVGERCVFFSSARRLLSCPPARSDGVVLDAGRGEQPIREARPGIEELRLVEVDQKGGIETYVFARPGRPPASILPLAISPVIVVGDPAAGVENPRCVGKGFPGATSGDRRFGTREHGTWIFDPHRSGGGSPGLMGGGCLSVPSSGRFFRAVFRRRWIQIAAPLAAAAPPAAATPIAPIGIPGVRGGGGGAGSIPKPARIPARSPGR